jgi:hypothetical protein
MVAALTLPARVASNPIAAKVLRQTASMQVESIKTMVVLVETCPAIVVVEVVIQWTPY